MITYIIVYNIECTTAYRLLQCLNIGPIRRQPLYPIAKGIFGLSTCEQRYLNPFIQQQFHQIPAKKTGTSNNKYIFHYA